MTLVELITVVMMLGILATIGLPGIIGGIQRTGVDGASRQLTQDIRLAQSTAITRGAQARLIIFDQTGVVPTTPTNLTDATKANQYRIEMRSSVSAPWPAITDYPGANSNVVTAWNDLGSQYKGIAVTSGNALVFNSQGFLSNSATALNIVLAGSGGIRTVQTSVIGKATIQ
jgi:type II secretory pathway pseudopilin PulG